MQESVTYYTTKIANALGSLDVEFTAIDSDGIHEDGTIKIIVNGISRGNAGKLKRALLLTIKNLELRHNNSSNVATVSIFTLKESKKNKSVSLSNRSRKIITLVFFCFLVYFVYWWLSIPWQNKVQWVKLLILSLLGRITHQ